jgi:hypothetical protein
MKGKQPISTSLLFNVISNAAGTSVWKEAITTTEEGILIHLTGELMYK